MSFDTIQQNSKTIVEAAYKLAQQKSKKEQDETKKYILGLAVSIAQDVNEEKKQLQ